MADFSADVTGGYYPLTVHFTDRSRGSPTSWAWDFDNDGTVDSTSQNPSWTYSRSGTYSVALTVSDHGSTDREIITDYVTVAAPGPPEASFTADLTGGELPLTVHFTDRSPVLLPSWEWDFDNDGSVDSTLPDPVFTYPDEGTFSVSLTVSMLPVVILLQKTDYITITVPEMRLAWGPY
jgi:PKD repeat protein